MFSENNWRRDVPLYLVLALALIFTVTLIALESSLVPLFVWLPLVMWSLVYFRRRVR